MRQVRPAFVEEAKVMIREHEVSYRNGAVVVRDYGGTGPSVLLVHGPGFCAAAWDTVAASLGDDVHAYAIDLHGHGKSTSTPRTAVDSWGSVLAVVRELGLSAPLLVGLGLGSHACLAASLEAPGEIAGIVTLGGACVRTQESAEDDIAFYASSQFAEMLRTRFFFGFRGHSTKEAETLVDRMIARLGTDWRVVGFKGLREEVRYSIRPAPDGDGWVNMPLPSTITTMVSMKVGDRHFPDQSLYRRIDVPVLIVQLADGLDQEHARRERDLAVEHPPVSVRALDAGEYPHYTRHNEVAAIILDTCGVTPRPAVEADRNGGPGGA